MFSHSAMIRFHACVGFLIAFGYVAVGAIRWHQALGNDGELIARIASGILIYGNLLWLLLILLALPLLRWPRLALGLPTALVVAGAVTFEQAVTWNIRLPSLIPLRDPERLSTIFQASFLGILAGIAAGLLAAWMASRLSGIRSHEGERSLAGRQRWKMIFLFAQATLAVALVAWNSASMSRGISTQTGEVTSASDADRKLTLFCLDAGMWTVLDHFIDRGLMPNLAELKERSSYGHLMTHGKRLSPIVWTSIVTGKKESKHGIHGFTEFSNESDSQSIPTPSTSRNAAALWNVATAAQLKSLVFNWLITNPPETIDGVVIPNLKSTLAGIVPSTHPPAVKSSIEQTISKYPNQRSKNAYEDTTTLLEIEIDSYELASSLADYDLIIAGTQTSDSVLHKRYLHTFPEQFDLSMWDIGPDEAAAQANDAPDIFSRIDEWIGDMAKNDRALMIVSDHGTRPRDHPLIIFQLNSVLADIGLIDVIEEESDGASIQFDASRARAYEAGSNTWSSEIPFVFKDELIEGVSSSLNLDQVLETLRSLHLQDTGETLFTDVANLRTSESFPQLGSSSADGVVVVSSILRELPGDAKVEVGGRVYPLAKYVDVRRNSGNHDPHGMFLFSAPDVPPRGSVSALSSGTSFSTLLGYVLGTSRQADRVAEAARHLGLFEPYSSLDVTPTVLAYLNLPVAADMDGTTMTAVLGDANGTSLVDSHDHLLESNRTQEPIDSAAQAEIFEQLRELGYIR